MAKKLYNFKESFDWVNSYERNVLFLLACKNHINDLICFDGFIFLNDVLKKLGLPLEEDGYSYGWHNNPDYEGRSVFDFEYFPALDAPDEGEKAKEMIIELRGMCYLKDNWYQIYQEKRKKYDLES